MEKLTAKFLRKTQKIVKPYGLTQVDHWYHIFADYIESVDADYNTCTICRMMSGKSLIPWAMVRHYAGQGTRCPAALIDNLHDYIADHYTTQALREALRQAILEVLAMLPPEDQGDIREYWYDDDLANMWAVMLWYCVCCDYAAQTWAA